VAQKMAQKNDAPPPEHVAEAFLHFARLAAAHNNDCVSFVNVVGDQLIEREVDESSLRTLETVTHLLSEDRKRVGKRMADVLLARVRNIAKEEYVVVNETPFDAENEQQVEDRIERRLRDELGLTLSHHQKNCLAADDSYIKEHKGPANAAADALGRALGLETGRSVYEGSRSAREGPPVPGPMNRWVSLRKVRDYAAKVLDWADAVRRGTPTLSLTALRELGQVEPIIDRVEKLFREKVSRELDDESGRSVSFSLFYMASSQSRISRSRAKLRSDG
jgi:hypothetical protein